MSDVTPPDCQIYVDAGISESELAGLIAQFLLPDVGSAPGYEAEIIPNEDYDSNRRKQFPGGFIYFRYVIDLYLETPAFNERAALVARLLEGLWAYGFPAVAACAFEDHLPHGGGYKSRDVPWVS